MNMYGQDFVTDEYGIQVIQLFNQNGLNPKEVEGIIISSVAL